MTAYAGFLAGKRLTAAPSGIEVEGARINTRLFPFQRDLVRWSLAKGRSALFATTGMGKTPMQLEWARLIADRTLILTPLAVAQQTVREAAKFGIEATYCRSEGDAPARGIVVTNYEMLSHFNPLGYGAVVLDESGILKHYSGETKKLLVETFQATPYRLCCTATPAPNDTVELTNHAEFLSIGNRRDVLTRFFISKGQDQKSNRFRLKGHAHGHFYRWLASWAMTLNKPSDLGYTDEGYVLPPLQITPVFVETNWRPDGQLFPTGLKGVGHRAEVRRATIADRVAAAVTRVQSEPTEQWLLWCGLNDEGRALAKAIPGAVNIEGSDDPETKADALLRFAAGEYRVLITKPSIAGFGLNFQTCSRMAFVGLGDSYEQYFQAIRRCWRFGQTKPVHAYIVLSDVESPVYENVLRKEQEHQDWSRELLAAVAEIEHGELSGLLSSDDPYLAGEPPLLPAWLTSEELVWAS